MSDVATYPTGSVHRRVRAVALAQRGWVVVDELANRRGRRLVERLTDPRDEESQADAVARDYAAQATRAGCPLAKRPARSR